MRVALLSSLAIVVLGLSAQPVFAQTDPSPCCAVANFQTFNAQDVAIQLVSVERTGPDDITVTWQILNRSRTPQQFDKMAGLAAYQLVWDAEVIDLASRTRFKVASDPKTRIPVAAKHDPPRASQGVGLAAGRTLTTWAKFLVPANVTKVTVTLPGAARPWDSVTITPSGSTSPPVATPILTALTLSLDSIAGGPGPDQPTGKVTLSGPAPAGGLVVSLSSDNAAVTVPQSMTVPAGATEATFEVRTALVPAVTSVRIAANAGSASVSDQLQVLLGVASVTFEGVAPQTATQRFYRITMSGPAPAEGLEVSPILTNPLGSHPCFPPPTFSRAIIPPGATSVVVTITNDRALRKDWYWRVVYGYRTWPQQPLLLQLPTTQPQVDIPTTLTGGTTAYGTVRVDRTTPISSCYALSDYDPEIDYLFTAHFRSDSPAVVVPESALIDPGQSSRPFMITAAAVQAAQTATITVLRRTPPGTPGNLVAVKQVLVTVTP
jgi:hypothetical protein